MGNGLLDPSIEPIASAVHPLRLSVWGELGISLFTNKVVVCSYMFIPLPEEFDLVVQRLLDAGFRHTPWSFNTIDPADPRLQIPHIKRLHEKSISGFKSLDENSIRFEFPDRVDNDNRVVLLRSDYVELCPPRNTDDVDTAKFIKPDPNAEIYYPKIPVLLDSFIRTMFKEPRRGAKWRMKLESWTISYLYGLTDVSEDALDGCRSDVKEWYRNAVEPCKATRGIVSKRVGRVNPRDPTTNSTSK